MILRCATCGTDFDVPDWRVKHAPKYCSYACRNRGRGVTAETRAKMSVSQRARGPRSEQTKARMRKAHALADHSKSAARLRELNVVANPSITHGQTRFGRVTGEYRAWRGMLKRCFNPNVAAYRHYGGRGITVCQEWRDSFESFFQAIGPKPSPAHSVDRINNDGHYEPGNVRWATQREQLSNRRPRKRKG